MPPHILAAFTRLARKCAGLEIPAEKAGLLSGRVMRRMRTLRVPTYRDYLAYLESHPEEVEAFVNAITINTTFFFRESTHFTHLHAWLRTLRDQGTREVRVWCGAASTGEEVYTLAMVASDAVGWAVDLRILGTDIDTRALARARRAAYPRSAIRRLPPEYRERLLPVVEPGHPGAVVDGRIRQLVRLGRLNLTSFPYRMRGPLDVIFIRNVLIYFDEPTRQQIIAECARLLRPGGLLYLGHSESAAGTRGFRQTAPSVYERC